ncbi:RNA-guided endonuclease InsQ/TnpB family protein [Hydrogenibacillus schlegelii]|uniref:Transposase n=2 Tax=Hydrogenibacillus schlegelii TaxID=1484 RepID=A0A179ISY2_HYDSH|nr:RNA-guided endonuclease TnpB family protein [Hydrogenibacillus schlegelii]OAR04929.1 transposase [Hydrogenibacillus schlegelii]
MAWSSASRPDRLLLTRQFPIGPDRLPEFEPIMQAANRIWNSCVWHSREIREKENRWPNEGELKAKFKFFKVWKELHSQSAQAVVEEYFEAVSGYRKHRENGHEEMRPPDFKPKKHLRTVTWKKQGFDVRPDGLGLKRSRGKDPVSVPLPAGWNVIVLPDGRSVTGTPVEVKVKAIVRRRKVENLILHVTFDFGVVPVRPEAGPVAAYDYNAAMLARATSAGVLDLFVGRELLAQIQDRNKGLAEFQAKLSRLREGSRRWRRLQAAKGRILEKLDRRIRPMEHALTKALAELDLKEGIATAVLGDLTGLRRSAGTGMKGKKASQKIHQMAYDRLGSQQGYKNLMRGIRTIFLPEKYTSSTCYACGRRDPSSRRHRGHWKCRRCGFSLQADLNGAGNLLKFRLAENVVGVPGPVSFHTIRHWRWDKRYNRYVRVSSRAGA